jgi:hypothetical protein
MSDTVWTQRRNRWAMPALLLAIAGLLLHLCGQLGQILFFQFMLPKLDHDVPQKIIPLVNLVHLFLLSLGDLCDFLALLAGATAIVQVRQRPDVETGKGMGMTAVILVLSSFLLRTLVWTCMSVWNYIRVSS